MADRKYPKELDLNDCVVKINDLKFSYSKKCKVLDGFSLTFPRGAIYGFLGPSGSGKTTVIKLISGLLKPSSGTILVNGRSPRHPKNFIPGPGIGYMPQEICLMEEFTILETFVYFGRIYGLSEDYLNKRIDFIKNFLDLPDINTFVSSLSGGQKRRTSLAVAIIHSPPILILDEPTVGVDPMLRQKIWDHLVKMSSEEKTSIILTTHYIDECRRADIVGLIRNAKLLAENEPKVLLNYFQTNSLEEVFLKLCIAEEQKLTHAMPPNLCLQMPSKEKIKEHALPVLHYYNPTAFKRFKALTLKNANTILRNKITFSMELLIPALTLVLFAFSIGNKPYDLDIALNSEERRDNQSLKVSERLLNKIDSKTIILNDYDSQSSAINSVKDGLTYGVLYVHKNFSIALKERLTNHLAALYDDNAIRMSTIIFTGDLSELNIFQTIFRTFLDAVYKFLAELIAVPIWPNTTAGNPQSLKPCFEVSNPPIYGSNDPLFRDFFLHGLMVTGAFILATALTGLALIEDREKGLLERTLIAGAKMHEILLSMLFVHIIVLLIQHIISIILIFIIFNFPNEGNYFLILILLLLQSTTGMCLGLLISTVADTPKMAIIIVTSTIIPFLQISGIAWPLEGMQWTTLRTISLLLPQTMAIKVFRAITLKGWSLNRFYVWWGYIIPLVWCLIFLLMSLITHQFRGESK